MIQTGRLYYQWDFGDTTTGSGVSPVHSYSAKGTYHVTLTVTDNEGAIGTYSKDINIGGGSFPLDNLASFSFGEYPFGSFFGEPVNSATGSYTATFKDLSMPGKGFAISFERSYNSQDNTNTGSLGYGWTHSYDLVLGFSQDDSVTVLLADGRRQTFSPNGDGTYRSPQGIFEKLVKNADGSYSYIYKDQSRMNFNAYGELTSLVDRFGNTTTLSYIDHRLTSVAAPGGRSITLTYTGRSHN